MPLITPTTGILNWTRKEIEDLDKATRRIMCYSGNLHMRSDINRIYVPRKQGGRGLASIEDTFTSSIVALANHIEAAAASNPFLEKVKEHEQNNIIRLRDQLLQYHDIEPQKYTKSALKTKLKRDHLEKHGKTSCSIATSSKRSKRIMRSTNKHHISTVRISHGNRKQRDLVEHVN